MNAAPLRIVTLSGFLPGYRLIADWARRHGHEIVLAVTVPTGAGDRSGPEADPLVAELAGETAVLVTRKLRSVAAPAIAALGPDLVISAGFSRLIPPEILDIPTYGALNLHPSPLPAGRGPNPARLVYEGATTIGATLHRTSREFDTGAVLSWRERPLPRDLSGPAVFAAWSEMGAEVIEEGTRLAVAGDPGVPQDEAEASEAPFFTEAEHLIDLTEPASVVRRKVAALNVFGPRARVRVTGSEATVLRLYEVPSERRGEPGEVLAEHSDGWTVRTADRTLRIEVGAP